ncbi:MAG: ABC transporter substrate-binding protein [Actinomycetota bacterium]
MKRIRWVAPIVVLMMIAAACAGDDETEPTGGGTGSVSGQLPDTGNVNLLSAGEPEEVAAYQEIFDELINADAEYNAEVESAGNFEEQFQIRAEGGTLDVAAVPQPGAIPGLVDAGSLVSLEDMGFNIDELNALLGESFVALGEYNGAHDGLPTNINLKSMVWYPKAAFDAKGYTVPETWDDLLALSDQIVADGSTPWCVGYKSEGSTGWPATDWMEDIMLRTAGADVYDQWYKHEIPFNDPSVLNAATVFGDVMFADGYVLGGAEATPDIEFGDAPLPMFESPPNCWLHRQASFINAFFPEGTVAGEDYDWFPLPPIDQEGTLYAGELSVVGVNGNRPEVVDFLNQFIDQEVQCAMGGVAASSRISPNVNVGPECYANDILADASVILTEALASGTGRFDASDLMPAEVGSGSFWTGMVDYMRSGPDSVEGVLDDIEASWPA